MSSADTAPAPWWRPIRRGDRRDGWRADTRVWVTYCRRHGVMADTDRRWERCPVCRRPMVVDARLDYPEEGPAAGIRPPRARGCNQHDP